jgi:hypothetical protein
MARTWTIDLPLVPRSYNGSRYQHWRVTRKEHQELSNAILQGLMLASVPRSPVGRIEAFATLTFPTRRRRDTGNFRTPLEKALGDCLQTHGALEDDTHELYEFGWLRFSPNPGPPSTCLILNAIPALHKEPHDQQQRSSSTPTG